MRLLRAIGGRLLLSLIIGIALGAVSAARAQDSPAVAQISSPGEGAHLFGPVNITGTAQHPAAFDRYTLEYDLLSDVSADWILVQEPVTQQVQEGVLGTWNTSAVPDGIYQLRLRVYLDTGEFSEAIVSNLRVQNSQPTPVPTTGPAGIAPGAGATPGPTPTSPVIQPPTVIPQLALEEPTPVESSGGAPDSSLLQRETGTGSASINFSQVQQAFCTGGIVALVIFVALAVYAGVRRVSRGGPPRPLAGDDY